MDVRPGMRRVVVVGVGMGLFLVLLEAGTPRGWGSALSAMVSLVPVALALAVAGPWAAVLATVVGMGGAAALLSPVSAVVVLAKHAAPGAALGWALDRRWPIAPTLLGTVAVGLVGLLALVTLLAPSGLSPLAFLERQLAAQATAIEQWPARLGVGSEPNWAGDAARVVAGTMRVAGPGLLALGILLSVLVNYVVARACFRRPGFRPFAEERVPDHLVWAVIGAGLVLATREPRLETLGINGLLVLTPVYALQGLAVLRHFFVRLGVPRLLQTVSFGMFAMWPLLLLAVACVGLSDLWIDFRKLRRAPTPA